MKAYKCPTCGERAITLREKLLSRKANFACMHCHSSLRLHPLWVGPSFAVTGLMILLPYTYFGVSGRIALYSLACLLAFAGVLLIAPLQGVSETGSNA